MENTMISYVAGVASLIALIISVYNSLIEKRRLIAETITKNRIEWIINVRRLLIEFLDNYYSANAIGMLLVHDKVALYMNNYNPNYNKLLIAMRTCAYDNPQSRESIDSVILLSQEVLSSVWIRMKREAGIKRKNEAAFLNKLQEELNDGPIR